MSFLAKIQRWIGTLFIAFGLFAEAFGPIVAPTQIGFLVPYASAIILIGFFLIFYSFLKVYRPLLWIFYILFAAFLFWFYFLK